MANVETGEGNTFSCLLSDLNEIVDTNTAEKLVHFLELTPLEKEKVLKSCNPGWSLFSGLRDRDQLTMTKLRNLFTGIRHIKALQVIEEYMKGSAEDEYHSAEEDNACADKTPEEEFNEWVKENPSFLDVVTKIGLKQWTTSYPLALEDALQITMIALDSSSEVSCENVLPLFFSRMLALDHRAVAIFTKFGLEKTTLPGQRQLPRPTVEENIEQPRKKTSTWVTKFQQRSSNTSEKIKSALNCMDSMFVLLHCCCPLLRQTLMVKMSLCQLAVPVLIREPIGHRISFLLWELLDVKKSWFCGKKPIEQHVVSYPFPTVAAVRLGSSKSYSKSKILNAMLGVVQGNPSHEYFIPSDFDDEKSVLTTGNVEAVWFLPSDEPTSEDHTFSTPICFLNYRGPLLSDSKTPQEKFIYSFATCVVAFCEEESILDFRHKIDEIINETYVILVPIPVEFNTQETGDTVTDDNITILHVNTRDNPKIGQKICRELNLCLGKTLLGKKNATLHTDGARLCEQFNISNTLLTSNCKSAKQAAELVSAWSKRPLSLADNYTTLFILQYNWQKISNIVRSRLPKGLQTKIYHHEKDIKREREKQRSQCDSHQMNEFIDKVKTFSKHELAFTFRWIDILFYKILSDQSTLQRQPEIGTNVVMRELGQMYESLSEGQDDLSPSQTKRMISVKSIAVELLLSGIPIEIFDDKAHNVPLTWVKAILEEVNRNFGNLRVFTISALGIQSSGKSTLLNTLFGTSFPVSSGRCTRGISFQMIKVDTFMKNKLNCDFLCILDTQGLGSPEKHYENTNSIDNQIATFVIGLSDVTLLTIRGEIINSDLTNILQVVMYSFIKMSEISLNPCLHIVWQAVDDIMVSQRNQAAGWNLVDALNNAVKIGGKIEKKSDRFRSLSDIFHVKETSECEFGIHYAPSIFQNKMTPPNREYVESVYNIKRKILLSAMKSKSRCLFIADFIRRLDDLWLAVLQEDFVMSFRNTEALFHYTELSNSYLDWTLNLNDEILYWEIRHDHRLKNSDSEALGDTYNGLMREYETFAKSLKEDISEKLNDFVKDSRERYLGIHLESFKRDLQTCIERAQHHTQANLKRTLDTVLQRKKKLQSHAPEIKQILQDKVLKVAKEMLKSYGSEGMQDQKIQECFDETWDNEIRALREKYPRNVTNFANKIETSIKDSLGIADVQIKQHVTNAMHENLSAFCELSDNAIVDAIGVHQQMISESACCEVNENLSALRKFIHENEEKSCRIKSVLSKENECTTKVYPLPYSHEDMTISTPRLVNLENVNVQSNLIQFQFHMISQAENSAHSQSIFRGHKSFEFCFSPFDPLSEIDMPRLRLLVKNCLKERNETHSTLLHKAVPCFLSKLCFVIQSIMRVHYLCNVIKTPLAFKMIIGNVPNFARLYSIIKEVRIQVSKRHANSVGGVNKPDEFEAEVTQHLDDIRNSKFGENEDTYEVVNNYVDIIEKCASRTCFDEGDLRKEVYLDKMYDELHRSLHAKLEKVTMKRWQKVVEEECSKKLWNIERIKHSVLGALGCQSLCDYSLLENDRAVTDIKFSKLPWHRSLLVILDRSLVEKLNVLHTETYRLLLEELFGIKKTFLTNLKATERFNGNQVNVVISNTIHKLKSKRELEASDIAIVVTHMCAWMKVFYVSAENAFEYENDVVNTLCKEKETFFRRFRVSCLTKFSYESQANEVFEAILPNLESVIKTLLLRKLRNKIKTLNMFTSRNHIVFSFLCNLCEKGKFEDYTSYFRDSQQSMREWINREIVLQCGDDFLKIVQGVSSGLIEEVKDCFQKTFSVVTASNTESSSLWFETFFSALNEKNTLSCYLTIGHNLPECFVINDPVQFEESFLTTLNQVALDYETNITEIITEGTVEDITAWIAHATLDFPEVLISHYFRCCEICPLCKAPCSKVVAHDKHFADFHYPLGMTGVKNKAQLSVAICNHQSSFFKNLFASNRSEFVRTTYVRKKCKNWDISPLLDSRAADYWKWVFVKYSDKFNQLYDVDVTCIPPEWSEISQDQAIKCLKTVYLSH